MSEPMELVPASDTRLARPIDPEDPIGLFRLAIESKSGADTLERVMAVRRELRAEHAQAAFDRAMAAFQAKCPSIVKSKGVPTRDGSTAYKYAPLEDIIAQVKPLLQEFGFSYSIDTDTAAEHGWVIATCSITHAEGHTKTSKAKFPLGTKTGIMSDTQVYASALTFASRRVFCNAFGIVTAGEDMDGRIAKLKPKGPSAMEVDPEIKSLALELWNLLKPVRGEAKNWNQANQWLWREDILDGGIPEEAPHLPAARLRTVITEAKGKL